MRASSTFPLERCSCPNTNRCLRSTRWFSSVTKTNLALWCHYRNILRHTPSLKQQTLRTWSSVIGSHRENCSTIRKLSSSWLIAGLMAWLSPCIMVWLCWDSHRWASNGMSLWDLRVWEMPRSWDQGSMGRISMTRSLNLLMTVPNPRSLRRNTWKRWSLKSCVVNKAWSSGLNTLPSSVSSIISIQPNTTQLKSSMT